MTKNNETFFKNEGIAIFVKGNMVLGIHPDNLENNAKALNNGAIGIDWELALELANKNKKGESDMPEKIKVDVQRSIFNGMGNNRDAEKFMEDLREVMLKHNVKYIRADYMEIDEDEVLLIRASEFIGKKPVSTSYKNRSDIDTNIIYSEAKND